MHSYRNEERVNATEAPKIILTIFNQLNARFFDNALFAPQILLTPDIREVIHFEKNTRFIFNRQDEEIGHLNISASALSLSPHEFCAEMLHEMCHQYCFMHDIKDVSRGSHYHNKQFRDVAKSHGLIVAKDPTNRYGWCETVASPELVQWCRLNMPQRPVDLVYYRQSTPIAVNRTKKKIKNPNSHSKKYQCPICGDSWRATKYVYSMCKNHHAPVDMVLVDDPTIEYAV